MRTYEHFSRNPFRMHSSKKYGRRGGVFFRFRRSPLATHHSPQNSSSFFSDSCALFCTFLHFLARTKNSTLFFYRVSTFFAKKKAGLTSFKPKASLAPRPPGAARGHVRPYLYFLTSLHRCFYISLQYNRCASIRGRNEFQPASRRNPHRFRAPLLGRQHHRTLRASLLLRRVRFFGPLPSRSPQLPDGARDEFDRALWRPGMVPGYLRGSNRRPARLSPRSFPRLSDPRRLVLLAWFDRIFVACAGTKLFAAGSSRDDSSGSASPGGRPGEALRGRHDRAGLQRERPFHRLLHLLHFGEHRRRVRTLARRINQRTPANRQRVPDG